MEQAASSLYLHFHHYSCNYCIVSNTPTNSFLFRIICVRKGGEVKRRYSTLHIPCPPALYAYVLLSPSIRDPRRLIRDTRRSIRDIRPVNSGHSAVEYRELTGEYRELTGEYRELTGEYLELMDRSNMRSSLSVIAMYFDL